MKYELIRRMLDAVDDQYIAEAAPAKAGCREGAANTTTSRKRIKYILTVAAIIAALAGMGALAVHEYWHMPDSGERYEGSQWEELGSVEYPVPDDSEDGGSSNLPDADESGQVTESTSPDTSDTSDTPAPPADESGTTVPDTPQPSPAIADEWFIAEAAVILKTVNKWDIDAEQLIVKRSINKADEREEVSVMLRGDGQKSTATFNADTGDFLGASTFDKVYLDNTLMSTEDALKCAEEFYKSLPYPQGYEFSHLTRFDDHGWTYSFSRAVTVEAGGTTHKLLSDYEQVRITIDPCSGSFEMCNSFSYPLLDDHGPDQNPVTADEAMELAVKSGMVSGITAENTTAELVICRPNPGVMSVYNGTEQGSIVGFKNYPITRIAWQLHCKYDYGFARGSFKVFVDLYTGEVLDLSQYR